MSNLKPEEFAALLTKALEAKDLAEQCSIEQELWYTHHFDFQAFLGEMNVLKNSKKDLYYKIIKL